jgi:hypothetical protein
MDLTHLLKKLHLYEFLKLIRRGLYSLGINIRLLYLVSEGLSDKDARNFKPDLDDYGIEFLDPKDMSEISILPGREVAEEHFLVRFEKGQKCLGIKNKGKIIAFTWCNFDKIGINLMRFPLNLDEAYLFDAYTLIPYRGKGVAPYLRYEMYKELNKLGKHKLYSYTDYFNTAAVKFKEKLNAKITGVYLIVALFKKWCFFIQLRRFKNEPEPGKHQLNRFVRVAKKLNSL